MIDSDDSDVLIDKTEALTLHSKRTQRLQKRRTTKAKKLKGGGNLDLLDLPYELLMDILALLEPSDLFRLLRTNKSVHAFISREGVTLSKRIIQWRYLCLEKCFRLPVLLENVDPAYHSILQSEERQEILSIHKKPYQHIQPPNPSLICTCLTCMLRWNALCLIADFAFWQNNLDQGEPIPMIPRGRYPEWNQELVSANAAVVMKALRSPLWYARLLQTHLSSIVRAIKRHSENRGNKRRRFRMSAEDAASGTDLFLERSGPPTMDFPFHRDNYYMLEAYLPNRGWSDQGRWVYVPAEQHNTDIGFVMRWAEWKGIKPAKPSVKTLGVGTVP
jgi:hypothetical protein